MAVGGSICPQIRNPKTTFDIIVAHKNVLKMIKDKKFIQQLPVMITVHDMDVHLQSHSNMLVSTTLICNYDLSYDVC